MWRVSEEEWSCDLYDVGGILPVAAAHCSDLELWLLSPVTKRQFRQSGASVLRGLGYSRPATSHRHRIASL